MYSLPDVSLTHVFLCDIGAKVNEAVDFFCFTVFHRQTGIDLAVHLLTDSTLYFMASSFSPPLLNCLQALLSWPGDGSLLMTVGQCRPQSQFNVFKHILVVNSFSLFFDYLLHYSVVYVKEHETQHAAALFGSGLHRTRVCDLSVT